ncbi:nitroreductase family protein [Haloechinothrix sp. YIM 98757]|uniref:Nitroreductase family protein n=1 Tax=Haloechinothrix aidingensis TaxID=2752311 RepID=A0A838ACA2_9PSEU|nr:nitroreductase family protein [Haloechinothrix aidingensis]MBA0126870.1 nitroreductase family protein [Haloechinothrix aidingensis]
MTGWTLADLAVLDRALCTTPSVHNTMPWIVESGSERVDLLEWTDRPPRQHDPTGRDLLLSCGAAVTNLRVAARSLGWSSAVELFPEPDRPALIARITPGARRSVDDGDMALYGALYRRRSYRRPFTSQQVDSGVASALAREGSGEDVRAHRVMAPEIERVAEALTYAASVLRADAALQRELAAWNGGHVAGATGNGRAAAGSDTLPWAGLVRATTRITDVPTLAGRLAGEQLLIIATDTDTAADQVRAGAAVQRAWLAAVASGLAGSVLTQPLHLDEVRDRIRDGLGITGYPQILLRFGYPADTGQESPRDLRDYLRRNETRGALR